MMVEKVLEKSVTKYCLATISEGYCWYLKSLHGIGGWEVVSDIEQATKTATKGVAKIVRENYENDMGKNALEFVVIPIIIDYSLVKEVD